LAEIVGTLARLTVQLRITLSLQFEDGGGFVISGGQMPFLRYRPNRGAEILATDYSDRMQKLACDLGLRADPVPAPSKPQPLEEAAEIMSTDDLSCEEEDRPMEDPEDTDGPNL
jgi:hypothetical protein